MKASYTIILPAFNAGSSISRCLGSIVAARKQHDLNLVLIDDGSTDNTREICEDYTARYPWITLLRQNRNGPAAARNLGISHAQGTHLAFVDADDTVDESLFDFVSEKLKATDADIVIFGHRRMMLDGRCVSRQNITASLARADISRIQLNVTENWPVFLFLWSRVINTRVLGDLRFDNKIKMGSDTVFNIACVNRADHVEVFPDCLYNYYENPNSVTSAQFKPGLLASVEAHYRGRVAAHIWPTSANDSEVLLQDIARSYMERLLPYLLNNLRYLPPAGRRAELRRIRDSFVFEECVPHYVHRHPATTLRFLINCFVRRKEAVTLLTLWATWRLSDWRQRVRLRTSRKARANKA